MRLSTHYCGISLANPLVVGASPMVDDLDVLKRLEDAGAAAVVMRSLFQEQIERESMSTFGHMEDMAHAFGEALSFFPETEDFRLGPQEYLDSLRKVKQAVNIPVVASLNGTSMGGWLDYGKLTEEAGADALELNFYELPTDFERSGAEVEAEALEVVRALSSEVSIPISVKLSTFWSSLPHFCKGLVDAGAKGLVLFNRFYQADIDIEDLEYIRHIQLSQPRELSERLRAIAILYGRTDASLICTGGVHGVEDLVKAIMSGADAVQIVAAILSRGPEHLTKMRDGLQTWMEEHEYDKLEDLKGCMSLAHCPDPHALLRGNYAQLLQTWVADRGGFFV